MKNPILTQEIVRHIMSSVGIIPDKFGKIALGECETDKTIKISYENSDEDGRNDHYDSHQKQYANCPVYAGSVILDSVKLRGLIVNLTADIIEFCFVFRLGEYPIHGMILNEHDECSFKILNEKTGWADASIGVQGMVLGGMEKVVEYGLLWETTKEFDDLYSAATSLIGA